MVTFIRFTSIFVLAVSAQMIASGNAVAANSSAPASVDAQATLLQVADLQATKPSVELKDDSTYTPPDNGGPDSTQGSGTR